MTSPAESDPRGEHDDELGADAVASSAAPSGTRLRHAPLVLVALLMPLCASGIVAAYVGDDGRGWGADRLFDWSLLALAGGLGVLVVSSRGLPRGAVWSGVPVASMM